MTPFVTLTGMAAPLMRDNIDTDIIIPSREIRSTGKTGLADGLFAPWRYIDADARTPDPAFVLNDPHHAGAPILVSGANFGCGSSREHAVWALREYGIGCIIAESFAPIFRNNCIRNGVLPIALPRAICERLAGTVITVDLERQLAGSEQFAIDAEAKAMLIAGADAIDMTMTMRDAILDWQARDRAARPYIYLERIDD